MLEERKAKTEKIVEGIAQYCDEVEKLCWKAINIGIVERNSMLMAYYKGNLDTMHDIMKIIKDGEFKSIIKEIEDEILKTNKAGVETQ